MCDLDLDLLACTDSFNNDILDQDDSSLDSILSINSTNCDDDDNNPFLLLNAPSPREEDDEVIETSLPPPVIASKTKGSKRRLSNNIKRNSKKRKTQVELDLERNPIPLPRFIVADPSQRNTHKENNMNSIINSVKEAVKSSCYKELIHYGIEVTGYGDTFRGKANWASFVGLMLLREGSMIHAAYTIAKYFKDNNCADIKYKSVDEFSKELDSLITSYAMEKDKDREFYAGLYNQSVVIVKDCDKLVAEYKSGNNRIYTLISKVITAFIQTNLESCAPIPTTNL